MYSFIGGETDRLKFRIVTGVAFPTYLIDWPALPKNGSEQPHHAQHVTMKQILFGICNVTEAMGKCLRTWRVEPMNLFELKFFDPAMQASLRINVVKWKLAVSGRLRGACGALPALGAAPTPTRRPGLGSREPPIRREAPWCLLNCNGHGVNSRANGETALIYPHQYSTAISCEVGSVVRV